MDRFIDVKLGMAS